MALKQLWGKTHVFKKVAKCSNCFSFSPVLSLDSLCSFRRTLIIRPSFDKHRNHFQKFLNECVSKWQRQNAAQYCRLGENLVYRLSRRCIHSKISCRLTKINHQGNPFAVACRFKTLPSTTGRNPEFIKKRANVESKQTTLPKSSEVKRLLSLSGAEKWTILGAVGLLLISSGVTMSVPFCMGKVIDVIYTTSQDDHFISRLNSICQILVVVFIIGGTANFGRVYLMQMAGQRIIKKLRGKLFSSLIKQEVGFFDKTRTGELINRLSTDTSLVGNSVTMNISDGLRSVAQAIGGVGMMVYVSAKLALFSLAVVPPVAAMSIIYGRYMRGITRQVQDSLASATELAEEKLSNIRTVRAFAHEDKECVAYGQKIEDVLKLSYKESLARGIFFGFTGLTGNLIVLSVFYYGGMMMTESQITVGELSAFLLYAAYVGISIGGLSSFYTELNRGLGASSRLWELIDRQPAIPVSGCELPAGSIRTLPTAQGSISFSNVAFSYPSRPDVNIFSNFSLTAPAGQVTAVVGPSGCGKSTVFGLLLRFYDPVSGNIMLDEHDIKTLDPTWLRSHIGTVSQDPILFSCSVAENIAYGSRSPASVTFNQIEEAARKANAYNFVKEFPQGFDTLVGERGLMLSGGQRQRIAIARAILKNPEILLLDEATSALDAESEYLVHDALEKLMTGRTVLTIAHRLSTIKTADQIAVINQGQVAEIGSYSELMSIKEGFFKKLVERQTISLS